MKVGREPERDPRAARRRARGDRRRRGALRRRERRVLARRRRSRWARAATRRVGRHAGSRSRCRRPTSTACGSSATAAAGLDVAAGEYGYVPRDFRNLLGARRLPAGRRHPLRRHHRPPARRRRSRTRTGSTSRATARRSSRRTRSARVERLRHLEYFHDHVRIESMLFDGVLEPGRTARCVPDRSRPGNGLELKRAEARAVGGVIARAAREPPRRPDAEAARRHDGAVSAPPLAFEIYLEHYKGSFGDKWMWTPIVLTPPLTAAGVAGVVSRARGADGAAGRVGALLPRRADRHRHARPGRAQAAGRLRASRRTTSSWARRCSRPGSLCLVGALGLARGDRASASAEMPTSASRAPAEAAATVADPHELPRQRKGITPQMHGRYPDYDVLEQAGHWDEVTRRVVLDRVENVPPIRFFDDAEAATLQRVLRRRDRAGRASRGSRCSRSSTRSSHEGQRDGYQYFDMPDDGETWRLVARGLDEEARARGARRRSPLRRPDAQIEIVPRASRRPSSHGGAWDDAQRRARLVGRDALRPARRSTRTRGPGTRSASAARPTRAATRASAARTSASDGALGGARGAATSTRSATCSERGLD